MKLDKAQRTQVIALAGLIAVLVGYGVYTMTGKKGPPFPPPVHQSSAETEQARQLAGAPASSAVQVAELAVNVGPAARRDPFAPCVTAEQPSRPAQPARPLPRLPRQEGLPILPMGSANVALDVRPRLPGVEIGPAAFVAPEPQFVLTGIIKGDINVAIIRVGSSGRHIVREGQMIDGNYRVRAIKRGGVVLTRGSHSIYLKLGGTTNAS